MKRTVKQLTAKALLRRSVEDRRIDMLDDMASKILDGAGDCRSIDSHLSGIAAKRRTELKQKVSLPRCTVIKANGHRCGSLSSLNGRCEFHNLDFDEQQARRQADRSRNDIHRAQRRQDRARRLGLA